MSYELDPEKRQGLLETAACEGNQIICGLELRPMTLATWSLHCRVREAAGDAKDWAFDLFSFVFLHHVAESHLRAYFGRAALLIPEIYDFIAARSPADVSQLQPWVRSQMEMFTASLTVADSGSGVDVSDPK